jgi:hypothetical protein
MFLKGIAAALPERTPAWFRSMDDPARTKSSHVLITLESASTAQKVSVAKRTPRGVLME